MPLPHSSAESQGGWAAQNSDAGIRTTERGTVKSATVSREATSGTGRELSEFCPSRAPRTHPIIYTARNTQNSTPCPAPDTPRAPPSKLPLSLWQPPYKKGRPRDTPNRGFEACIRPLFPVASAPARASARVPASLDSESALLPRAAASESVSLRPGHPEGWAVRPRPEQPWCCALPPLGC